MGIYCKIAVFSYLLITGVIFYISGESKPSQPVSRSGSDRRPDIVREEAPKNAEGTTSTDQNKQENDTSTSDK